MEGRWQAYSKVVNADQEVKDGWKILRMLGAELELEGFDYFTVEEVREEINELVDKSISFSNELKTIPAISLSAHQQNDDAEENKIYRMGKCANLFY